MMWVVENWIGVVAGILMIIGVATIICRCVRNGIMATVDFVWSDMEVYRFGDVFAIATRSILRIAFAPVYLLAWITMNNYFLSWTSRN